MTPDKWIYTKKGDSGETGLFSGERVEKTSIRVESYGTLDELNAALGVAKVFASTKVMTIIGNVQRRLYLVNSELASTDDSNLVRKTGKEDVTWLEVVMDDLSEEMPVINHFVIPGGTKSGACLHLARTICRRAERIVIRLSHETTINPEIIRFMNRLSDFIFVLARYANIMDGEGDEIITRDGVEMQTRNG